MELNVLYNSKHIMKASGNAYQFAVMNEFFYYYILQYKIREFDIVGAIDAEQWDVAYWSSKDALKFAIKIFLFCKEKDQYSTEAGYFLLSRLRMAMADEEDKYKLIEHIFYANEQDIDGMKKEINLTQTIIKDYLIPHEIWGIWGGHNQFNFSSYLQSVIITKKAFKNIDKTLMERPTHPIELLEEMNERSQRVSKGK